MAQKLTYEALEKRIQELEQENTKHKQVEKALIRGEKKMKLINAEKAPAAIGPYCHAVVADTFVFCSGQLGLDPDTMEFAGNSVEAQTDQVMKNIKIVLEKAGTSMDKIIKTTVFLNDINDFPVMNRVYEKSLAGHKPARAAVEVARLPKDALVEIECTALL